MSTEINKENYESFYLDYLEGNLTGEALQAFVTFLNKHPELKTDDELPVFHQAESTLLDQVFLQQLKVFDAEQVIDEHTCESFMIASCEGILTDKKEAELLAFIAQNTHLKRDFDWYKQAKLVPDTTHVYPNKSELRRGFVIPMYAKFTAVAAGVALIVMLLPSQTSDDNALKANLASLDWSFQVVQAQKTNTHKGVQAISSAKETQNQLVHASQPIDAKTAPITLLPKSIHAISSIEEERDPLAYNLKIQAPVYTVPALDQNEGEAYLTLDEMKNPFPNLTHEIKKRFKKDLDIRTAKAAKNKQGGFYLKIGKFEISRKTAPLTDEQLASN